MHGSSALCMSILMTTVSMIRVSGLSSVTKDWIFRSCGCNLATLLAQPLQMLNADGGPLASSNLIVPGA